MGKMTGIPAMIVSIFLFCGSASAAFPANSIGPAFIADRLFGLNYERAISPWFGIDVLGATSGKIDFAGMRLMLSRQDPAFQVRPSLGMCMVRGEYDEGESEEDSPWFGFIWPGLGINYRAAGHLSVTLDLSAIYGNTGEDDEIFGALSAALMYMF